jgi:hypothetical protein
MVLGGSFFNYNVVAEFANAEILFAKIATATKQRAGTR